MELRDNRRLAHGPCGVQGDGERGEVMRYGKHLGRGDMHTSQEPSDQVGRIEVPGDHAESGYPLPERVPA